MNLFFYCKVPNIEYPFRTVKLHYVAETHGHYSWLLGNASLGTANNQMDSLQCHQIFIGDSEENSLVDMIRLAFHGSTKSMNYKCHENIDFTYAFGLERKGIIPLRTKRIFQN